MPHEAKARLYVECDMERGEVLPLGEGEVGVFSHGAPIEGRANEDGAALIFFDPPVSVLAVADGLGGTRGGGSAARCALEILIKTLTENPDDERGKRAVILDGFDRANEGVRALGSGGATTLAVALVEDGSVRTFHVGDSEILVVGQRGKLKLRTVSHSPTAYAVEAGLISAREAMHHEDRHIISNCVGSAEMRVDVGSPLPLSRFDTILMGSDGLFDNLHTSEIVERCRKGPLAGVLGDLSRHADRRMNQPEEGKQPSKIDDVTFIVARPRCG